MAVNTIVDARARFPKLACDLGRGLLQAPYLPRRPVSCCATSAHPSATLYHVQQYVGSLIGALGTAVVRLPCGRLCSIKHTCGYRRTHASDDVSMLARESRRCRRSPFDYSFFKSQLFCTFAAGESRAASLPTGAEKRLNRNNGRTPADANMAHILCRINQLRCNLRFALRLGP